MKKTFIFALTIVLTASLLTACRSKAPEETAGPTNGTTQQTDSTGGTGKARNGDGCMPGR